MASNLIDVKFCVEPGDRSVGIYEHWHCMIEFGNVRIFADMPYNEPVENWPVTEVQQNDDPVSFSGPNADQTLMLGQFDDIIIGRVKQMYEIHQQEQKVEALAELCGWAINSYIDELEWEQPEGWKQQVAKLRQEAGRGVGQYRSAQRKLTRLYREAGIEDAYDLVQVLS